jgi:glyoxylase-like metal-dependent hydrolase (beta-lactamase superfamily II)
MIWLIGLLVALAALAGIFWYAALDAAAPARAEGEFDLAAYRALTENDAAADLPSEVRIEFVGVGSAPSFATEAGAFGDERAMSYNSFQIVAPSGDTIIDGAVDEATATEMDGTFNAEGYQRVLDAMTRSPNVLITHEHLDHVMAVARHPEPAALAPNLDLTREQLDGLPEHALNGQLAPEIAEVRTLDFTQPTRIAPGVVAHATPGHTPGTITIYVRGREHEYLFVGDIVWVMSSIEHLRGRPRFIRWIMPAVDPDRPAVLRQIRALHDIAAAEPELVIVPAHDDVYLRDLIARGVLVERFAAPPAANVELQPAPAPAP